MGIRVVLESNEGNYIDFNKATGTENYLRDASILILVILEERKPIAEFNWANITGFYKIKGNDK